jgi:hypothetical protein
MIFRWKLPVGEPGLSKCGLNQTPLASMFSMRTCTYAVAHNVFESIINMPPLSKTGIVLEHNIGQCWIAHDDRRPRTYSYLDKVAIVG